jgi:hypothetical protein
MRGGVDGVEEGADMPFPDERRWLCFNTFRSTAATYLRFRSVATDCCKIATGVKKLTFAPVEKAVLLRQNYGES